MIGDYIFKEQPNYYEVICSKCGAKDKRTNKSKKINFVCHNCKQKRNRERTRLMQKVDKTLLTENKSV